MGLKYSTGCPKKALPQIQNKKCFSLRVNVMECKKIYFVKVIDLREGFKKNKIVELYTKVGGVSA